MEKIDVLDEGYVRLVDTLGNDAQFEIQEYAKAIRELMASAFPTTSRIFL